MSRNLYSNILKGISNALLKSLNEGSLSMRTIDRKLWLSVASVCSRNKATEAEFVKPMRRMSKQELIDRYVSALLIMKKPCPETEEDIDNIKTFKLLAHKAIEEGATLDDIKYVYNSNNGSSKSVNNTQPVSTKSVVTPTKVTFSKQSSNKGLKLLESFTQTCTDSDLKNIQTYDLNIDKSKTFVKCLPFIEKYLRKLVKNANKNLNIFSQVLLTDYMNMVNAISIDLPENNKLMYIYKSIGGTYSTFRSTSKSFQYWFTKEGDVNCIISINEHNVNRDKTITNDIDMNEPLKTYPMYHINEMVSREDRDKLDINLENLLSVRLFIELIRPYAKYKLENKYNSNIKSSGNVLKKYNMVSEPSNYYKWFKDNIKNILKSNPENIILESGSDYNWNGYIRAMRYSNGKYHMVVELYNDNSDYTSTDLLDNLLRLPEGYGYRYKVGNYVCEINNFQKMAKSIFKDIKKLIEQGKLI